MEGGVVKEVTDCLALDAIHELRVRAWAAEGLLPPGTLFDGTLTDPLEESARHWVLRLEGAVIAAARLTVHPTGAELPDSDQRQQETLRLPGPIAAMNRLVVCPAHRGRGRARLLDKARVEAAHTAGCRFAVVAAHGQRVAVLRALGFAVACSAVSRFVTIDGGERFVESAVLVLPLKQPER
jgi:GNAT superfamily N-acetyltransferase